MYDISNLRVNQRQCLVWHLTVTSNIPMYTFLL